MFGMLLPSANKIVSTVYTQFIKHEIHLNYCDTSYETYGNRFYLLPKGEY